MINQLLIWITNDLRVDAQLNLEDAELMRIGFAWSEVQTMSVAQRQIHLAAGHIVNNFHKMGDRRTEIDVAVLSSGFADKNAKLAIVTRWDKEASDNLEQLAEFSLEPISVMIQGNKPKVKTKNFAAVLQEVKNGKINNIRRRHESPGTTSSAVA